MASTLSMATTGISYGNFRPNRTHVSVGGGRRRVAVRAEGINPEIRKTEEKVVDSVLVTDITKPVTAYCSVGGRRYVAVRAEGINPEIRKTEEKLADSVLVTDITKPVTAYCRCWRSKTFPLCDGSHVKHNKSTGDNVGPLLLKTK